MQAFAPQDKDVKLELKDVAIAVLQLDGPLILLALVVLFDSKALPMMPLVVLLNRSSSSVGILKKLKYSRGVLGIIVGFQLY